MNAEEEPEHEDYPKNPEFRKKFGPRGVLHSWANTDGTQRIEDTGPLTRKRMETVDDETSDAAIKFIKAKDGGKPFFVWWNGTRMHFRTHVKPELRGISGQDEYAERHGRARPPRRQATEVARRLGPETPSSFIRPTTVRTTTPGRTRRRRRSAAKNTNWEGGWRVPAMVRWPGQIKPASVSNEIMHHMDWLPTFAAAAGDPDVKNKLLKGFKAGNTSYKVYLDGYNFLPLLTGKEAKGPRKEIF